MSRAQILGLLQRSVDNNPYGGRRPSKGIRHCLQEVMEPSGVRRCAKYASGAALIGGRRRAAAGYLVGGRQRSVKQIEAAQLFAERARGYHDWKLAHPAGTRKQYFAQFAPLHLGSGRKPRGAALIGGRRRRAHGGCGPCYNPCEDRRMFHEMYAAPEYGQHVEPEYYEYDMPEYEGAYGEALIGGRRPARGLRHCVAKRGNRCAKYAPGAAPAGFSLRALEEAGPRMHAIPDLPDWSLDANPRGITWPKFRHLYSVSYQHAHEGKKPSQAQISAAWKRYDDVSMQPDVVSGNGRRRRM